MMLAAFGTRTSAFLAPSLSRTGHWNALRRIAVDSSSRTRVGRLLAVDSSSVEVRPSVADEGVGDAPSVKSPFLQTLVERGFYHQCTDVSGLDKKMATGEIVKAYLGFDATANRYVGRCMMRWRIRGMVQCRETPGC